MPWSDYDNQFKKVILVAKSVAGLTTMIDQQQKKAAEARKKYDTSKKNEDYAVFSKACEAVMKGSKALTKEVAVLATEGSKLEKIMTAILKEKK